LFSRLKRLNWRLREGVSAILVRKAAVRRWAVTTLSLRSGARRSKAAVV
jgi:hypothetical protein